MTSDPPQLYKEPLQEIIDKINAGEIKVNKIEETGFNNNLKLRDKDRGFLQPISQPPSEQNSKYLARISTQISWDNMKEDLDGQKIMIKDITKQWEELANLWLVCERDAREAAFYKRQFRFASWIFGGVATIIFGIILILTAPNTQQNNQQNWQRIVGLLFTGGGAISTGGLVIERLDKYTDSKASRQRAVELRSLKEDVSNHMTDIKIKLKHYFYQDKENLVFDDFYKKYKEIRDETTRLHKESYKLGVKV